MGLISLGFLAFSLVMLYVGLGWLGFTICILIAGGVVYVLIFVLGTPEPEGGWWTVTVEVESNSSIEDEASFSLKVETPGQDPVLNLALGQKAAYLLEHQFYRVAGQEGGGDYELRLISGVAGKDAWLGRRGDNSTQKARGGYVHYLVMEAWKDAEMHWGGTASLERDQPRLENQLDALLAAAFDCFGRGELQEIEKVPTREHAYVRLLQDQFGPL